MIFGLNFTFLSKYWFYYMDGLKVTLQLAFWTLILSSIVGVIMGMIRVQNYKIISTIIDWWINFIRGVPIMVQIFIVYYGIATSLPQFWAAVVSLSDVPPSLLVYLPLKAAHPHTGLITEYSPAQYLVLCYLELTR